MSYDLPMVEIALWTFHACFFFPYETHLCLSLCISCPFALNVKHIKKLFYVIAMSLEWIGCLQLSILPFLLSSLSSGCRQAWASSFAEGLHQAEGHSSLLGLQLLPITACLVLSLSGGALLACCPSLTVVPFLCRPTPTSLSCSPAISLLARSLSIPRCFPAVTLLPASDVESQSWIHLPA